MREVTSFINGTTSVSLIPINHPEQWSVDVRPHDGSSVVVREVDQEEWESINVGDEWQD